MRSMGSRQIAEWMAFVKLAGPLSSVRADLHAAQITRMYAEVNRDSKKHPEPYKLEDFVLRWGEGEDEKPVDDDALTRKILKGFMSLGARIVGK